MLAANSPFSFCQTLHFLFPIPFIPFVSSFSFLCELFTPSLYCPPEVFMKPCAPRSLTSLKNLCSTLLLIIFLHTTNLTKKCGT